MNHVRRLISASPVLRSLSRKVSALGFRGTDEYWESRYASGGNSGAGSTGDLARFKADFLNDFVRQHAVSSVIEFGCGDGNQLSLAHYPAYIGLDVSRTALRRCADRFAADPRMSFFLYDPDVFVDNRRVFSSDLALSLDVIYHLVEDAHYSQYMAHLFRAADRFVIIYSSNHEGTDPAAHVRHRRFTDWPSRHAAQWRLTAQVNNRYPFDPSRPRATSFANFYIYERSNETAGADAHVPDPSARPN